jgi:hypothetical protein
MKRINRKPRSKMYLFGVDWIAFNDEPGCMEVETVAGFISTLLLADLFDQRPDDVATDIIESRNRELHGNASMDQDRREHSDSPSP